MPYIKGTATDHEDMLSQLCTWVSDAAIHGDDAWEVMRNEPWPKGTIVKAHGWGEGEHFYLGFMPKKIIKGQTFAEWFFQREVIMREFVWSQNGLNITPGNPNVKIIVSGNAVVVAIVDKDGNQIDSTTYYIQTSDIFEASSWPLFLGAFKQYSAELDWVEQAGAYQPRPMTFPLLYINSKNPTSRNKYTPPPLPGVGFPAMSMDINGPIAGVFDWWAVKDRHRIVIATNNSGYWDVAHLGFLEPYHKPYEYACPLCVIGGTSGAKSVGESIYYSPGQRYPTPTLGFRFDYTPGNPNLSRGLPISADSPAPSGVSWYEDNYFSQVQLMLADGTWSSFFNWTSAKQVITESCGESISYYYADQTPVRNTVVKSFIMPTNENVGKLRHTYTDDIDKFIYTLKPIELVHGTNEVTARADMLGRLWRIYWPSSKVLRYGEVTFDGKKYLIVPNGNAGRLWYYPHGKTGITNIEQLISQYNEIASMSEGMDACLIRLEE